MPGILSGEGIMVPEACLGSAHLSPISVGKQGWGPSKMTLVSVQDSGYLAADGNDGVGVYGEIGGRSLGGRWVVVTVTVCPPPTGPWPPPRERALMGTRTAPCWLETSSVCSPLPRSWLHRVLFSIFDRMRRFYSDAAVNLETD